MKDKILVLGTLGAAPEWLQILPLGKVELRDSRQPFEVTAADLEAIIQKFQADGVDLVVDYEHQSLSGNKAVAAGWITELQARGDGLYARVEWTRDAVAHIDGKEYRYYSPVLQMAPNTRRPQKLMHVGLTNVPAIKNLAPLLAAKFGGEGEPEVLMLKDPPEKMSGPQKQEEATAMFKNLILKLGLTPEATEAEVLALVDSREQEAVALKQLVAALPEIATVLGLEANATISQIKGTVLALKQGQDELAGLKGKVLALETESSEAKAEAAVSEALKARKITPAEREFALKHARRDLAEFRAWVAAKPEVVPGNLNLPRSGPGAGGVDAEELAMCCLMGIKPEAFKITKDTLAQEGR